MVVEFFEQLHALHPVLDYLARVILGSLLALVAWVALAIPVAALHNAVTPGLRALMALSLWAAQRLKTLTWELWAAISEPSDAFVSSVKLRLVFDRSERELRRNLRAIRAEVPRLAKATNEIPRRFAESLVDLRGAVSGIRGATISTSEVPDTSKLVVEESTRRRAKVKFCIYLFAAIGLILVNTLMLNEFFSSIILVRFFIFGYDITVAFVLSLFFSLMELVLGISLYFQQLALSKEDIRSRLAELTILLLIGALMVVEGVFYLALSTQIEISLFEALFAPNPVPPIVRMWLAPLGPVVVGVLAFAGHHLIEGLDEMRQATIARGLRDLSRNLTTDFEKVRLRAEEAKKVTAELGKLLSGKDGDAASAARAIEELTQRLDAVAIEAEQARRQPTAPVDEAESRRLYFFLLGLATGSAAVIAVSIWAQMIFLTGLVQSEVGRPLIACSIAAIVLAASYFISSRIRVITAGDESLTVAPARISVASAASGIAIIAVVGFYYFLTVRSNDVDQWLWFLLLVATVCFLVYVGPVLPLMTSALWSLARTVGRLISLAVVAVLAFAMLLPYCLAGILVFVLTAVAYPALWLADRLFRRPPRPEPVVRAQRAA